MGGTSSEGPQVPEAFENLRQTVDLDPGVKETPQHSVDIQPLLSGKRIPTTPISPWQLFERKLFSPIFDLEMLKEPKVAVSQLLGAKNTVSASSGQSDSSSNSKNLNDPYFEVSDTISVSSKLIDHNPELSDFPVRLHPEEELVRKLAPERPEQPDYGRGHLQGWAPRSSMDSPSAKKLRRQNNRPGLAGAVLRTPLSLIN